jgi:urocanate hydratase
MSSFKKAVLAGIPDQLPPTKPYDHQISHAPKRKDCLTPEEKKLAICNALRYFKPVFHPILAKEFAEELADYGRIYMYRFRPDYPIYARSIDEYPHQSKQAAAIMLMLQNNLDPDVAQHPQELMGPFFKIGHSTF